MDDLANAVERCENRASFLGNKLSEVNKSVKAVKDNCSSARLSLDLHYEKIKMQIVKALDDHYHDLTEMIDKTKIDDLASLNALREQLQNDLNYVQELIKKGQVGLTLDNEVFENEEKANEDKNSNENKIEEKSENEDPSSLCKEIQLGLDTLVKSNSEMPCSSLNIIVKLDDAKVPSAVESLKNCLDVSCFGGLQITDCMEMPGSILVRWDEPSAETESIDTDNSTIAEYTLQYASCMACKPLDHDDAALVFNTLYTGEEMQYLMTDVEVNQSYHFRVCKSRTGLTRHDGDFGPWSLPKKGWTTLSPHEWNSEDCANEGSLTVYELGNKNRTATKVFPESCKILRSQHSSCRLGHVINFKIVEAGERSSKDGLGLVTKRFDKTAVELLIGSPESIIVNTKGAIYVNGTVMVMRLPVLKRGSILSFQTSKITEEKLRVTISNEDKEVTFDWLTGGDDNEFSFAASFEHTGWQLTVY